MSEHLAKDAGEGKGSVIGCQRFVAFFENGHCISLCPAAGSLPVFNDRSKMTLMTEAISSRSSRSKRGLSISGPAALPGLRLWSNFKSPFGDMSTSGMIVLRVVLSVREGVRRQSTCIS